MSITDPSLIVTLCTPHGLSQPDLATAKDALTTAGGFISAETTIDEGFAIDWVVRDITQADARAVLENALPAVDVIVQPSGSGRVKKLLLADMDSTMIGQECIDELADYAGKKTEIAEITERAMQGELDFQAALEARVAALRGLPATAIGQCLAERIVLMPGARTLIQTMKAKGARCVLISGGFTAFTQTIAEKIGFDRQIANVLNIADDALDGTVQMPIVDSSTKRNTLLAEAEALGLAAHETLAVGDGANDIPMLQAAGIGIAYHAKPKASAAADAAVRVGDLTALLWAQGIPRAQWVAAD